jgi:hypothetical protein
MRGFVVSNVRFQNIHQATAGSNQGHLIYTMYGHPRDVLIEDIDSVNNTVSFLHLYHDVDNEYNDPRSHRNIENLTVRRVWIHGRTHHRAFYGWSRTATRVVLEDWLVEGATVSMDAPSTQTSGGIMRRIRASSSSVVGPRTTSESEALAGRGWLVVDSVGPGL